MDIDACVSDALFDAFARDAVEASERALIWAHSARCEACAQRLQGIAVEEDAALGTVITAPEDSGNSGTPRPPTEYGRGDTIGRYMVIEELGRGGLGLVYLAYDPDLDRRVAIKVLRGRAASSSDATLHKIRLMREAKAMAQFSHPNIVAVYDVGVSRGDVFIGMEFVDGLGLRQWVSANRPTWSEIRDVMVDAARALEEAHAAGLVHRDFKPSNVLVTESRLVKVLDFGLARNIATRQDAEASVVVDDIDFHESGDFHTPEPLSRAAALDEPLTQSGQLMGTPGYMAPEQYDARQLVDARSDQFAFCVTLHEVLYRRRPYRGRSFEEVRDATLGGVISEPPQNADVPAWLREVVLKGISTRADDRFADMSELIADLLRDQVGTRRRWGMVAAGFGLSAALGAGAMFFLRGEPVPEEVQRVEAIASAANEAAAASFYVYPPADDPTAPTAYTKVLELEALDGPAETLADERAEELRASFADALMRLGDRYWEEDGGKPFATDYYSAALIFDPNRDRARQRMVLTPGELATLKSRAQTADFSEAELVAAGSLIALAEEDDQRRVEKLAAHYRKHEVSVATTTSLERLIGEDDTRRIAKSTKRVPAEDPDLLAAADARDAGSDEGAEDAASDGERGGDASGLDETTGESDAADTPDADAGEPSAGGNEASASSPRENSAALARTKAAEGRSAFRSNQLERAAQLFHQALELDSRNRTALEGLTTLEFERGRYREALRYGRKAIRRSPKDADLRIMVGDAYYKTVDYAAARREYEVARSLGHSQASGRIARLDRKQGK